MKIVSHIKAIWNARSVLYYLTISELSVTYKGKKLGVLWAVLDPLIYLAIYYLLIKVIFQRGSDEFMALLFSGIIAHRWFSQSVGSSVKSLLANGKLIQSITVPVVIFPMSQTLIYTVNYLLGLLVLIPILIFLKVEMTSYVLWLPLLLLLQLNFNMAFAVLTSYIGVYFRDLSNIIAFSLRLLLYVSPVLYDASDLPSKLYEPYMILNPFAPLFMSYKNVLVYGLPPSPYIISTIVVWFLATVGCFYYMNRGNRIVKYL